MLFDDPTPETAGPPASGAELAALLGGVPARRWRDAARAGSAGAVERWVVEQGFAPKPVEDRGMPYGAWVRAVDEDGYPAVLAAMPAPPVLVWGIGVPPGEPGLAAVGSRHTSPAGVRAAVGAAGAALDAGVWLVSGHAQGCDRAAERAALDAGVPVLSILGGVSGELDDDGQQLVRGGGCVLWEHPSAPSAASLQARNRLVVAAAHCVVVCHGELGSGTARTAAEALRQKRFVVVPANAGSLCVALSGRDADVLGFSGEALEAAKAAARHGQVANAVARTPRELRELAAFAVAFARA
jgi:predicted Rossmann fold nucleotide-binding protein DprA/Smf involved in DNA uptake